jgi:hypothetical protein
MWCCINKSKSTPIVILWLLMLRTAERLIGKCILITNRSGKVDEDQITALVEMFW